MLAIVKGETDERLTISQLVRIAIVSMAAGPTWEILQDPNAWNADLARLQQDWQSLEFVAPFEQTIKFERIELLRQFAQARTSSKKFNQFWGDLYYAPETPVKENMIPRSMLTPRSLFLRKWDELRWRWFWSYQDELRGLQESQGLKPDQNPSDDLRNCFSHTLNSLVSAKRKAVTVETAKNVVITAIALKRFELRNHRLPATLADMTPDLLKTVPIDFMDGQPLRYRPNADGTFLLYSVGQNGKDDGGDPSLGERRHEFKFLLAKSSRAGLGLAAARDGGGNSEVLRAAKQFALIRAIRGLRRRFFPL